MKIWVLLRYFCRSQNHNFEKKGSQFLSKLHNIIYSGLMRVKLTRPHLLLYFIARKSAFRHQSYTLIRLCPGVQKGLCKCCERSHRAALFRWQMTIKTNVLTKDWINLSQMKIINFTPLIIPDGFDSVSNQIYDFSSTQASKRCEVQTLCQIATLFLLNFIVSIKSWVWQFIKCTFYATRNKVIRNLQIIMALLIKIHLVLIKCD